MMGSITYIPLYAEYKNKMRDKLEGLEGKEYDDAMALVADGNLPNFHLFSK